MESTFLHHFVGTGGESLEAFATKLTLHATMYDGQFYRSQVKLSLTQGPRCVTEGRPLQLGAPSKIA
jgi:hypothetical protein